MVIFTREIAEELIKRGFELEEITSKAWHFKDAELLRDAVCELLEELEGKYR